MNKAHFLYSIRLRSVFFYLTGRCNLDCSYCYFKHKRKVRDLDLSFARLMLDLLKFHPDRSSIRFIMSGGEPALAWPLLKSMVKNIRKHFRSNSIKVQTNATLLDPAKLRFLNDQGLGLEIGIDGDFISTRRHRLGVSVSSYKHIAECIICACKFRLPVSATMTVHPDDAANILKNYLDLSSLGLRNIDITPAAFQGWNGHKIACFKSEYSRFLGFLKNRSVSGAGLLTSEDKFQGGLKWDLSIEGDGVVLPGDVFLCLNPGEKRRFSLFHFQKGELTGKPDNFSYFKSQFEKLALDPREKSFSAKDYVILSFLILKNLLPAGKKHGCDIMADLLSFLKKSNQRHILK